MYGRRWFAFGCRSVLCELIGILRLHTQGFYFSNLESIVGVEYNPYFTNIQNQIVKKYKMQSRVKVICNDIQKEKELLGRADVVLLNNVFDAFVEGAEQLQIWEYILSSVSKKGAIIITHPSIETSLEQAGVCSTEIHQTNSLRYKTRLI